jgi:hypothetical protein
VDVAPYSQSVEPRCLRPQLRVYLGSNRLEGIPGELCKLSGLTLLSLRGNKLAEIPSAIEKLDGAEVLNFGTNILHHLPYEILSITRNGNSCLKSLLLHPNPFYQPADVEIGTSSAFTTTPTLSAPSREGWCQQYFCRTQVRFMNELGLVIQGPEFDDTKELFSRNRSRSPRADDSSSMELQLPVAAANDIPEHPANGGRASRAPSLVELCVRSLARSTKLTDINEWLQGCDPFHMGRVLHDAAVLRESEGGDRLCTVCHGPFVIPRTEWIEWWKIERLSAADNEPPPRSHSSWGRDATERLVPLMRRGCSWKCVPPSDEQRLVAMPTHARIE